MFLIAVTSFRYDEDSSSKTYFHFGVVMRVAAANEKEKFHFFFSIWCMRTWNWELEIPFCIEWRKKKEVLYADLNSAAFNEQCTMQIEITSSITQRNAREREKTEESLKTQTPFTCVRTY